VLIIVAAIVGVIEAWDPAPQILQCWDEGQNGGDPGLVLKQGYILDLSSPRYSFDDKISYCCGVGTWILYEDAAYNIGDNADALETFVITSQVTGSQFCAEMPDTFDNRASSIRYAGLPDGDQFDSISFYSNEHFSGVEEFPQDSYPRLHEPPRSIIVNGCSQWTLYDQENFQGNGICTDRPQDMIADCRPYFYEDAIKVTEKFGTSIKSAQKGCFV